MLILGHAGITLGAAALLAGALKGGHFFSNQKELA